MAHLETFAFPQIDKTAAIVNSAYILIPSVSKRSRLSLSVATCRNVAPHHLRLQDRITCAALWRHVTASVDRLPPAVLILSVAVSQICGVRYTDPFPPHSSGLRGPKHVQQGKHSGSTCDPPTPPPQCVSHSISRVCSTAPDTSSETPSAEKTDGGPSPLCCFSALATTKSRSDSNSSLVQKYQEIDNQSFSLQLNIELGAKHNFSRTTIRLPGHGG